MSPQHNLIRIKNPTYSSLPIRSAVAFHFPTRRPALGTPVTLPGLGYELYEATVVAIEQNRWPTEWKYMIQIEKEGETKEAKIEIGSIRIQDKNPHLP